MPSSYTDEGAVELQAAGENINTWGAPKLNSALTRLTKLSAGYRSIALTANYSLTSSNSSTSASDYEAYHGILKFTGTGTYTVTIPSKANRFEVINALTSDLIISTGSGSTATLKTGEKCGVICDGTNCYRVQPTDFGAQRITSVLDPSSAQDAATKAYVDATAFSSAGGTLPGQPGNAGRVITTDGTVASWGGLKLGRTSTTAAAYLETTGGTMLGGAYSSTGGVVGLVNGSGNPRLLTNSSGVVSAYTDADPSTAIPLATQDFAKSFAIAAAVAL